jgi:hypothetical protein
MTGCVQDAAGCAAQALQARLSPLLPVGGDIADAGRASSIQVIRDLTRNTHSISRQFGPQQLHLNAI